MLIVKDGWRRFGLRGGRSKLRPYRVVVVAGETCVAVEGWPNWFPACAGKTGGAGESPMMAATQVRPYMKNKCW